MTKTANRGSNLRSAKKAKNDEFYTRLEVIENELKHYKHHFKDKVVYCNCDDPNISNFFRYFALNFDHLGLKKLITSCYRNTDPDLRSKGVSGEAVWLEYEGGYNNLDEIQKHTTVHSFNGDGDFRSEESIELLKEADVVVTNPPFSLFREYVAQLITYDKYFLILGNMNAITYKEIFPLLKNNKMWLGHKNGSMEFELPADAEMKASGYIDENGKKIQKFGNISWYTNLPHSKRYEDIILYQTYNAGDYPKYDNYDAINVNKVTDIPIDYDNIMGVPITFLDKYNPDQFEILGMTKTPICHDNDEGAELIKKYVGGMQHSKDGKITNTGKMNDGPTIFSEDKPDKFPHYTAVGVNGYLVAPYARILIKHKNPEVPTQ